MPLARGPFKLSPCPIMTLLESLRFGRIPAVLTVVVLAFALLGALGWVVAGQLVSLATKLPEYQQNLRQRSHPCGSPWEGVWTGVQQRFENLMSNCRVRRAV